MYVAHVDARASSPPDSVGTTGVVQRATKISTDHIDDLRESESPPHPELTVAIFCLLLDRDVRRVYDAILALRSGDGSNGDSDRGSERDGGGDEGRDSGIGSDISHGTDGHGSGSGSDAEPGSIHHARRVDARARLGHGFGHGLGSRHTAVSHKMFPRLGSAPAVLTCAAPRVPSPSASVHSSPSSSTSPSASPEDAPAPQLPSPSGSSVASKPSTPATPPPQTDTPAVVVNSPTDDGNEVEVELELADDLDGLPSANTEFFSAQEDGWSSQVTLASPGLPEAESEPGLESGAVGNVEDVSPDEKGTAWAGSPPGSPSPRSPSPAVISPAAPFPGPTSATPAPTAISTGSPTSPPIPASPFASPHAPLPAEFSVPDDVFSEILGAGLTAQSRRARRTRTPTSPVPISIPSPSTVAGPPPSPSSPVRSPRASSPSPTRAKFRFPIQRQLPPGHPFNTLRSIPEIPNSNSNSASQPKPATTAPPRARKPPPSLTPSLLAAEEAEAARRRENLSDGGGCRPLPGNVLQRLSQYPPATSDLEAPKTQSKPTQRRGRSGSDVPLCGWRRRSDHKESKEEGKSRPGKDKEAKRSGKWKNKGDGEDAGISAPFNPVHHAHGAHPDTAYTNAANANNAAQANSAHADGRTAQAQTPLPPPPRPRPYENAIPAGPQNRMVDGVVYTAPSGHSASGYAVRPLRRAPPPPPSPPSSRPNEQKDGGIKASDHKHNDAGANGRKEDTHKNNGHKENHTPPKKRNPLNLTVETRPLPLTPSPLKPARKVRVSSQSQPEPLLAAQENTLGPYVGHARVLPDLPVANPPNVQYSPTAEDDREAEEVHKSPGGADSHADGHVLSETSRTPALTRHTPQTSIATISTAQNSDAPLLHTSPPPGAPTPTPPRSAVERLLAILRLLRLRLRPSSTHKNQSDVVGCLHLRRWTAPSPTFYLTPAASPTLTHAHAYVPSHSHAYTPTPAPAPALASSTPRPSLWTRLRTAPPIWTLHTPPAAPTFPPYPYDDEYEYEFVDYPRGRARPII